MAQLDKSHVALVLTSPGSFQRTQYELSEREFMSLLWRLPNMRRAQLIVVLTMVGILAVAVWAMNRGATGFAGALVVLAAFYPFVMWIILAPTYRKAFRTSRASVGTEIELVYGQGFLAQTSASTFSYVTSLYRVRRTKAFRLLGMSSHLYVIVPVRAFEGPSDLAEFDRITTELAHGRVIGK